MMDLSKREKRKKGKKKTMMGVEENGMEWAMGEGFKWMEKKAKFQETGHESRAEPSRVFSGYHAKQT